MKANYKNDLCYGVTKDPNESDYMLVFGHRVLYDDNLSEIFGEITWKYKIDDKLFDSLNEIINKDYDMRTTNLSNELLATLKIIENCTSCKDNKGKYYLNKFLYLINEIDELEKENREWKKSSIIDGLKYELICMDDIFNRKVLCKSCGGKN